MYVPQQANKVSECSYTKVHKYVEATEVEVDGGEVKWTGAI